MESRKVALPACAIVLSVAFAVASAASPPRTYIEFLWSKTPEGAIARQETRGFVLEGGNTPQVCVAVIEEKGPVQSLRIEAVDGAGVIVSSRRHDDFRGTKRCYAAELPRDATPGQWSFNVYLDDGALAATKSIEVARDLANAEFYRPSLLPYVLGRPNHDASVPPDQWSGRLVWVMHVDAAGAVTGVEVEVAEGVGVLLRERAIAAGHLSLFPPDPSRPPDATCRRELNFSPDKG